jgi:hypothetical protein
MKPVSRIVASSEGSPFRLGSFRRGYSWMGISPAGESNERCPGQHYGQRKMSFLVQLIYLQG